MARFILRRLLLALITLWLLATIVFIITNVLPTDVGRTILGPFAPAESVAALKTNGIWNSSQYSSKEFDAAFSEFQKAVGVDAQKAACTKIETILNEDVPVGLPYFYNYLAGNSNKFQGVFSSALGQMSFSQTSKVG